MFMQRATAPNEAIACSVITSQKQQICNWQITINLTFPASRAEAFRVRDVLAVAIAAVCKRRYITARVFKIQQLG